MIFVLSIYESNQIKIDNEKLDCNSDSLQVSNRNAILKNAVLSTLSDIYIFL